MLLGFELVHDLQDTLKGIDAGPLLSDQLFVGKFSFNHSPGTLYRFSLCNSHPLNNLFYVFFNLVWYPAFFFSINQK